MDISGIFYQDLSIEGLCIDRTQVLIDQIKNEMFPDTAVDTIEDWIRTRGALVSPSESLVVKRNAVVAKERSEGARTKAQFYAMAEALGFNKYIDGDTPAPYIRLVDGEYIGFIVGYSLVGADTIGDDNQYAVSCYGTYVSGSTGTQEEIDRATQLQDLFNNSRALGTSFVFIDE
jgi:hypothetical protein